MTPVLDPILVDILFTADELPVLRGGWRDRFSNLYVDEDPSLESSSRGPVRYFEVGTVDRKETKSPDPKKIQG